MTFLGKQKSRPCGSVRLGVAAALALCALLCLESHALADVRLEKAYLDYQNLTEKCEQELSELARSASVQGDQELVDQIAIQQHRLRSKLSPSDTLPRSVQPEISFDLPADRRAVHVAYRQACTSYAQDLYLLARRTQATAPVFAFELINLLLHFDPDHRTARSMRGYVRQGDLWLTTFERDKLRSQEVDHPRFGWIKEDHVERYEAGERLYKQSWLSAEKEALIRQDFDHAWDIETEHFQIRTNVSLEEGVKLGRKLELFYDYFIATFAPFYNSPEQLKQLFDSTTGRSKTRTQRYEIHFFRTKEEYVSRLVSRIPQIAITNGLYQLEDRTSYFFYDVEANNDATVFHETTHQLMYESHLRLRNIAQSGHFWIVEGIACYMESFRIIEQDGVRKYEVGDPRFIRFYWARHRLLEENYFIPLSTFSQLGMVPFQTGDTEELRRRYSQASGLAHFFMHYNEGQYRIALMQYLAQIYHSDPVVQRNTQELDAHTGIASEVLDQQYRQYIQDQQIAVGDQTVIQ